MSVKFAVLAALVLAVSAGGALAQDNVSVKERGPAQVHLNPYQLPMEGSRRNAEITLFLFSDDQDELWRICQRTIAVNDAVMMTVYHQPIRRTKDRKLDLADLERRLKDPINRAVGVPMVSRVVAVPGLIDPDHMKAGGIKVDDRRVTHPVGCGIIGFRAKELK